LLVLCIDVGAGTSDILLWDSEVRGENQTHLVVPSGTRMVGAEIREATRKGLGVVFRGELMGGGASSSAASKHLAEGLPFWAEDQAARTFSDDLDEVTEMGVQLVSGDEATALASRNDVVAVRSGDVRLDALLQALRLLGETREPDGYAVAVQDHGAAPKGMSDREFRFELLTRALARSPLLAELFYPADRIPQEFTRQRGAAACMAGAGGPVVLGDTGPSALWGAFLAAGGRRCLAVNYGNGHTIMSLIDGEALDGLFEHHTSRLRPESMEAYLHSFAEGRLTGEEVLQDGGHGALPVSQAFEPAEVRLVVTGPNRARFVASHPHAEEASLHGDMMIVGCWGLLQGFLHLHADR
jgi:uncharacterized protein (DUF1786 family)